MGACDFVQLVQITLGAETLPRLPLLESFSHCLSERSDQREFDDLKEWIERNRPAPDEIDRGNGAAASSEMTMGEKSTEYSLENWIRQALFLPSGPGGRILRIQMAHGV